MAPMDKRTVKNRAAVPLYPKGPADTLTMAIQSGSRVLACHGSRNEKERARAR
jgi:hypothetical protein